MVIPIYIHLVKWGLYSIGLLLSPHSFIHLENACHPLLRPDSNLNYTADSVTMLSNSDGPGSVITALKRHSNG